MFQPSICLQKPIKVQNLFQKFCWVLQLTVKDMISIAGVLQLTIEIKCKVLQIKLISNSVANT